MGNLYELLTYCLLPVNPPLVIGVAGDKILKPEARCLYFVNPLPAP